MGYATSLLTQNQVAIYDIEDVDKVEKYQWQAQWSPNTSSYYAVTTIKIDGKYTSLKMSRLIMSLAKGDKRQVDHINHNTLDNRKENLKIVTNKINSQNRRGVKGYSWNRRTEKWEAYIFVDSKNVYLGSFLLASDARQAYLSARQQYGFVELTPASKPVYREQLLRTSTEINRNRRGIKGYSWNKSKKKWQACISINSKTIHLGSFVTESEALQAYLNARENLIK